MKVLFNSQHRAMRKRRWAQQRAAHRRFLSSDIWLERIGTALVLLAVLATAYWFTHSASYRPALFIPVEDAR